MALSLDGTTGITSDSGTPVIENLNTTDTGIDITGQLTTTGNVGINTSSPSTKLDIKADSNSTTEWVFTAKNSAGSAVTEIGGYGYNHNLYHRFWINDSEKMRITDDGTLLVGKTAAENTTEGHRFEPYGFMSHVRDAQTIAIYNRLNSYGTVVDFRRDNNQVGSIGTRTVTESYILLGSAGLTGSNAGGGSLLPTQTGTAPSDNVVDLGYTSARFDNIYATNGTIQTSDRNEKQDIEALSEAEAQVAVACKGLLRKFRWKDAVAEKGDEARIHFGIIAQDLQDAFAAEGLDAGRYAMFISSTWWEAERVVPAVEEVLDDEGNVVTEAVAEHTVVDSYESAEEAPEGATERTRLGVRYPELLAFIIGAI